jgi:Dullard-like phosphatase family protein
MESDAERPTKPAVVFDLDETLVFGSPVGCPSPLAQIRVRRRKLFVRPRPHLNEFLEQIAPLFDIFFFTSSDPQYAKPIIDAMAPETPEQNRFFRDDCTPQSGYFVKDLRRLNRPLSSVILIDDMDGSAIFQPENLVRIAPWYGSDQADDVLMGQLLPILIEIHAAPDLPEALEKAIAHHSFPAVQLSQLLEASPHRAGLSLSSR